MLPELPQERWTFVLGSLFCTLCTSNRRPPCPDPVRCIPNQLDTRGAWSQPAASRMAKNALGRDLSGRACVTYGWPSTLSGTCQARDGRGQSSLLFFTASL